MVVANFMIRRRQIPPTYIKVEFTDDELRNVEYILVRVVDGDNNPISPMDEGRQNSEEADEFRPII